MLFCLVAVRQEGRKELILAKIKERQIVQWDFLCLNNISPIKPSPSMGSEAGSGTVAFDKDRGPWNSDRLLSVFNIPDESAIHESDSTRCPVPEASSSSRHRLREFESFASTSL